MSAARPKKNAPDPHSTGPTAGGPTQASVPAGAKNGGSPTAIGQGAPSGSRELYRQRKHQEASALQTRNKPGSTSGAAATQPWAQMSKPERRVALLADLNAGITYAKIAEKYGVTRVAVSGAARRLREKGDGVEKRRRGFTHGSRENAVEPPYAPLKPWERMSKREQRHAAADGVAAGMSQRQICKWLSAPSKGVIYSALCRHQSNTPTMEDLREKRDEGAARVLPLRRQGLTTALIAAKVGMTKSQVCGIIFRARQRGLIMPVKSVRRQFVPSGPRRPKKPEGPTAFNFGHRIEAKAKARPSSYIAKGAAFEPLPGVQPVAFGSPGCKFPVDGLHGRGLLACGLTRRDGSSYCDSHARLAYQPRLARAA